MLKFIAIPWSPFLTCAIHARPKHGSSAGWGGLAVAKEFRNIFCPHHQVLPGLAPSMWFGTVWKQARFGGHISASGKEMRHLCGIFWLGWFMDVGRDEGVAPSMWAFPAWFWRMSGSCAIYVAKRQLDVEEKLWVQTSAEDCKKYVIFRDIHGATDLFWMELRHLSPAFCLWHRWRNSINWAIYSGGGIYSSDSQPSFVSDLPVFFVKSSVFGGLLNAKTQDVSTSFLCKPIYIISKTLKNTRTNWTSVRLPVQSNQAIFYKSTTLENIFPWYPHNVAPYHPTSGEEQPSPRLSHPSCVKP